MEDITVENGNSPLEIWQAKRIKELEAMIDECIALPKGVEPHSVSDYKSTRSNNSSTPTGMGDAELSECCNAPIWVSGVVSKWNACLRCGEAV